MLDPSAFPALPAFALALIALFAKTTATSALQVVSRLRAGRFVIPEDAALLGTRPVATEAELPGRCANVWRNDVENLPLFLLLALSYVLLGGGYQSACLLFGTYVLLRYVHTAVYLLALQPWRALLYLAGMTVCWIIAAKVVMLALALLPAFR